MNATIDYQRIASSMVMNTTTPPSTRVSEDGMYITYHDKTLSIVKWRAGLRKLADEVKRELDDLCLNQTFGLHIPLDVFDDWGNGTRGYSWTKNQNFLEDKRSLLAAMLKRPELKLATLSSTGKFNFYMPQVWDFIHKCDRVNAKIALLAFFTAGQTPRVSEFVEHKYANSSRPRTLFRDHKSIWLATRRVKSENIMQKEAFLPMKCHPELTALLERYLLIVRPVEAELANVIWGPSEYHIYTEYLWMHEGKRVTSEDMRKSILEFTTDYFGIPIGTQVYRQMCVAIGRVFLGSELEIKQEEMDTLAIQAGHSTVIARLRYASEEGKVPSMSTDLLLRFGRISEAWWEVAGFRDGYPSMLPLRTRQEHREAALIQKVGFDTQAIVTIITQTLKETLNAAVEKGDISVEAAASIQREVAKTVNDKIVCKV